MTQSPPANLEDTQPTTPLDLSFDAVTNVHRRRSRRVLLMVIVVMSLSLIVSLFALWQLNDRGQSDAQTEAMAITISIGGETLEVLSTAQNVGALLAEQNILVEPEDIVSPGSETPLQPNMRVVIEHARTVTLTIDNETQTIRTSFENPYDILRSIGVTVNPSDFVLVDGESVTPGDLLAWPLPVQAIDITRALPVTVLDGEETLTFNTTGDTVGDALFEAGIALFVADSVSPPVTAPITANMDIVVDRSKAVTVVVDGTTIPTRVNAQTVIGALGEINVTISGLDYTIPDEDTALIPDMTIRVIRVTEELISDDEIIPYETTYQADNSMILDTRAVIQAGQVGVIRRTTRVRYENGIEFSRMLESEETAQTRVDEIIAYGTQIQLRTLDTPEGPVQYWRHMRMYATSYYPAELGGDNITSIGETLRKGIIGINPTIIPYRTMMYVPGYGQGMAADTGGPRRNPYWVDLGYSDEDFMGWSQWVDVYLITPVPDNFPYLLPEMSEGGVILD